VVDEIGVRKSTLGALLIWTFVFFVLGNCEKFYVLFANVFSRSAYLILFLYLNFSLLRFLGQSMLPMLGRIQLVKTFSENQGFAIAMSGIFSATVSGGAQHIMHFLTRGGEWQSAYKTLAVVAVGVFVVFFLFFEDVPSGIKFSPQPGGIVEPQIKISRRKLLKMPVFWCIALPVCINSLIGSGSMVHIVDIFRENGIGSRFARDSCFYLCCISVLTGPLFGRQIDQNKIKRCILMMLCLQLLGLIGLESCGSILGIALYVICTGSSWGGYGILKTAAWAKIFGDRDIGSILGLIYFSSAIVGAIGVSLMSFSSTHLGSYSHLMHAIEAVIIGVIIFVIRKFPGVV
jgi:hypothetical protein